MGRLEWAAGVRLHGEAGVVLSFQPQVEVRWAEIKGEADIGSRIILDTHPGIVVQQAGD